jgi:quercetin dioxygenase-like cupin family protein
LAKVFPYTAIKLEEVVMDGAKGVKVRWLITKETGAPNFAMRLFEVQPAGYTPLHSHAWEHEVFILDGEGALFDGEKATPLKLDDVVFVPANEPHQFKNTGKKLFRFICLIPYAKSEGC